MIISKVPSEKWPIYQNWLKSCLLSGPVSITFMKKDGSERTMQCTLSENLIPNTQPTIDKPKKERKISDSSLAVYDLENNSWKSFRWDSLMSVTIITGR